jgi:UDP-N-acetylglucosamine:LPS N-acetylglucosamine transferase
VLTFLGCVTFTLTGKGSFEPQQGQRDGGIVVESYRFKPTLAADMAAADLVISHAGAGSIMVCSKIFTYAICYIVQGAVRNTLLCTSDVIQICSTLMTHSIAR